MPPVHRLCLVVMLIPNSYKKCKVSLKPLDTSGTEQEKKFSDLQIIYRVYTR